MVYLQLHQATFGCLVVRLKNTCNIRIRIRNKRRHYLIPSRMRHAFHFYGMSWMEASWMRIWPFNDLLGSADEQFSTLTFPHKSITSLPIPRRGRLGWIERNMQTKSLVSAERNSRYLLRLRYNVVRGI